MKQTKDHDWKKFRPYRRHPMGLRLIAGLLCICLSLVSLPIEQFGYIVQAAQWQEVASFSVLPEEVRFQSVPSGTELEALNLPKTLEAVCRPMEDLQPVELPEREELFEASGEMKMDEEEGMGVLETGAEVSVEPEIPENVPESPEENANVQMMETVTIENVVWTSEPEYNKEIKGIYVFTPVFPESYRPAADAELPIITVDVVQDGQTEGEPEGNENKKENRKNRNEEPENGIEESLQPVMLKEKEEASPLAAPGCGTIGEDTVWERDVTLADGELIVEPGVTLTIKGVVTISGSVVIKGGGTIVRGSADARISVGSGACLSAGNIVLDGDSLASRYSMIEVVRGNVVLDDGCTIHNCVKNASWIGDVEMAGGGAAFGLRYGTAEFHDIVVENNYSTQGYGGAIYIGDGELNVYGGLYKNNRTTNTDPYKTWGGGGIYICESITHIYGGRFIENTSTARGGAIVCTPGASKLYLHGGYFEGNKSSFSGCEGAGAIYYCSFDNANPSSNDECPFFDLSGNVEFCGGGVDGTDGVYLELHPDSNKFRKIQISDTLRYPITFSLKASEGYVIAEGVNESQRLSESDVRKIRLLDVGGSGKSWYAVLDKEKNQVYVSENDPEYGCYIHYNSNGAQGTVIDSANNGKGYKAGETATVQPADGLNLEGYSFKEWNTQADGQGQGYQPGDTFTVEGDMNLYAIFQEKPKVTLTASFYSGAAGQKVMETILLDESEESGVITAPQLEAMDGWIPLGWSADPQGFTEEIAPDEEIILTGDKEYYGIYEKEAALFYHAENADSAPEDAAGKIYANVHDEVSVSPVKFLIDEPAVRFGYAFAGWNTEPDGSGETYREGDVLEVEEDTTLYAVFKRPLHACFYSGGAGEKEEQIVEIPEDATSGTTRTPELKSIEFKEDSESQGDLEEAEDWQPVGWDLQEDGYNGGIQAGEEVTLTDDTDFYGVYEKEVTLAYAEDEQDEAGESKPCRANVHSVITYDYPKFTLRPAPVRDGYVFQGWSTEPDGGGTLYRAESSQAFDRDTILYASWDVDYAAYRVEHYFQEVEGDGYVLGEIEGFSAVVGDTATAYAKDFPGFTENLEHELRYASGTVEEDGGLVLKLYYDRNVYHVDFDLNGGSGNMPEPQDVRYGACLRAVDAPERVGYHFKGWYMDKAGSDGKQWDFDGNVEENTESEDVTLYAKWVDETAPILRKALYGTGYTDFLGWILHRKNLKITVPITEEGSGVKQAEYVLIPESRKVSMSPGSVNTPLAMVSAGAGTGGNQKGRARLVTKNGQKMAEFTISDGFKGTVVMTASDWAGNVSAEKKLTSDGGGVIVEDNAPDIRFTPDEKGQSDSKYEIKVDVQDAADGNISGGIASVSYQIDDKKEILLSEEKFGSEIVESYKFTVEISGIGNHSLQVKAVDNAGNSNSRKMTVNIQRGKTKPGENPRIDSPQQQAGTGAGGLQPGSAPGTGDVSHVEIYATISMIAGFSYLLLYFRDHGMKEEKKEELVSRLVRWAKGKSGIRKMAALLLIFLLLAYYHSIGKSVDEWDKMGIDSPLGS